MNNSIPFWRAFRHTRFGQPKVYLSCLSSVSKLESIRRYAITKASTRNTDYEGGGDSIRLLPGQMLVGPPHPISNIRPIKFYVPADETPAERTYRELREEAVAKDHEFWLNNNMHFEQGKMDFERKAIQEKGQCTIDDLSEYFAKYQTDSYDRHLAYNRYVWRRNLQMIWPSLCAWFQEIRRRRRRKMAAYAKHSEQGYFDQQADSGSVVAERIQSNSVDGIVAASGNVKIDNTAETNANTASALDGKVDRRAEKIKSYY